MEEVMTDRQMEFIVNLVTEQFKDCETKEDVKKTIALVRGMVSGNKMKNNKDTQPNLV